ncbi:hypothetical protein VOM14_23285 [Paraburkholderia sp. MPAMCS5]|uniref:hypothetical protein n=1 Tax=Paraburkholderia sp. MPAMCS5 TaxID=3112563 RepID=UPI002E18D18C|nr:hypothetical protein [Paraburkholderia sp. MPAMCS5]
MSGDAEDDDRDVRPISNPTALDGTVAKLAVRLTNFKTGQDSLIGNHKIWLDAHVPRVLRTLEHSWIDIYGYASHRGTVHHYDNHGLSFRRCESLKHHIERWCDASIVKVEQAKGDSESTGGVDNNSGYWRATEMWIFGSQPKRREDPGPCTGYIEKPFQIRLTSYSEHSKWPSSIPGGNVGKMSLVEADFEITDRNSGDTAMFHYEGAGLGFKGLGNPKCDGPPTHFILRVPCSLNVNLGDFEGAMFAGFSGRTATLIFRDNRNFLKNSVLVHQVGSKTWGTVEVSTGTNLHFQTFLPTDGKLQKK